MFLNNGAQHPAHPLDRLAADEHYIVAPAHHIKDADKSRTLCAQTSEIFCCWVFVVLTWKNLRKQLVG